MARAYVADPEHPGQTLFRTGDIVRRRPDGAFVVLHRADQQLKVRGHRIEPHEVEAVLKEHPGVADAAVHAPAGPDGSTALVACVVPSGRNGAQPGLPEWCRERLPSYMVPGLWVELDGLPRTATGKVDRRSLPSEQDGRDRRREAVPRGPTEAMLAGIWSQVLDDRDVRRDDIFFEIGGHSLAAVRVVNMVEERTGHRLEPRSLFFRTLAEIAESLARRN
jgi:hypothetical protein